MLHNLSRSLAANVTSFASLPGRFFRHRLCRLPASRALTSVMAGSRENMTVNPKAQEVITYWLGTIDPTKPNSFPSSDKMKLWFRGGPAVDKEITTKFGALLRHAAETGFPEWQSGRNGLAAVLLMDQFTRNVYRGSAQMYDMDEKAMHRAQQLMDNGDADKLMLAERLWLALPFTHSEKLHDQQAAIAMISNMLDEARRLGDAVELQKYLQTQLQFAEVHMKVVEQWGRFPHRNALLGRANTPEEEKGLAAGSIPSF